MSTDRDLASEVQSLLGGFLEATKRCEIDLNRHADKDDRVFDEFRAEHKEIRSMIGDLKSRMSEKLAELDKSNAVLYAKVSVIGAVAGALPMIFSWLVKLSKIGAVGP